VGYLPPPLGKMCGLIALGVAWSVFLGCLSLSSLFDGPGSPQGDSFDV
jgi:hypothetical protein